MSQSKRAITPKLQFGSGAAARRQSGAEQERESEDPESERPSICTGLSPSLSLTARAGTPDLVAVRNREVVACKTETMKEGK